MRIGGPAYLSPATEYEAAVSTFSWNIPKFFNIGQAVTADHPPDHTALILVSEDGASETVSFGALDALSNRFANVLLAQGLVRGDRVGILLPQSLETAVAHIACYKAGLIAVPLFTLFGPDALSFRLGACGARTLVTDQDNLAKIAEIRDQLPGLKILYTIDGPTEESLDFQSAVERASDTFQPVETLADDPALIIFTSGTTGPPKGALHAHRVLLGHLPGVSFPHDFFPQKGDRFWTPADWAWIGGLLDVLLPSLYFGMPVVAHRARKFDPEAAFAFMAKYRVRNAFMPPTALKLMRQVPESAVPSDLAVRSIGSGGESLGTELLDWGRSRFGLTINEFYGQTECNLVVGNAAVCMPIRAGAMGRAIPGHEVQIIGPRGQPVAPGVQGDIGIRRKDPVMFLEYWQNPEATEAKFRGDWLITGDIGIQDEAGYFHYVGRDDDVITTAGYRVGPGEIEDCLMRHPAVAMAAVVGIPDPIRTQSIKAFIVLVAGTEGDDDLAQDIKNFVKGRLAAHEYPRDIDFVDALPMTTTGKIIRKALRDQA